uniref:Uncharacterized protein n=1 Tax=Anguilla anguilla TaxID=7936 RepID=A0A0E9RLZ4_ANGAN
MEPFHHRPSFLSLEKSK